MSNPLAAYVLGLGPNGRRSSLAATRTHVVETDASLEDGTAVARLIDTTWEPGQGADPLPQLHTTPFGLLSTAVWLPVVAAPGCVVEFIAEGPDAGNAIEVIRGVLEAPSPSITEIMKGA